AEAFFPAPGFPTVVPTEFDYRMLSRLDVVNLNGKDVGMLEFTNGPNRAKIYVLPRRDFRAAKNAPESMVGSHCAVEIVEFSKDYYFVIVYFGEANRQLFKPQGIVG